MSGQLPLYAALFKGMQAAFSCLGAGLLVWALLAAAVRRWPALASRRGLWLAAQGVTAGAALLAFLPPLPNGWAPTITIDGGIVAAASGAGPSLVTVPVTPPVASLSGSLSGSPSPSHAKAIPVAAPPPYAADRRLLAMAAAASVPAAISANPPAAAIDRHFPSLALSAAAVWAVVYAAGLALACLRQARARRWWRALLASAHRLSPGELRAHGGFDAAQLHAIAAGGLTVMETPATISPMLAGLRRPLLLLPRHLRELSTGQQHMIVAHELRHWRRRDPWWLAVSAALTTVFWFNPAPRALHARLAWALELSCDQHVLAGRPRQERKQYAAALLRQWQAQMAHMSAMTPSPHGLAFGGATAAARVRQIQQMPPVGLPVSGRAVAWTATAVLAVALAAVLALAAMLQPALAFTAPRGAATPAMAAAPATAPAAADAAPPPPHVYSGPYQRWNAPLDRMRVTGFFGVRRDVSPTPHKGLDLAAAPGTPVHAAAPGVVVSAGALAENDGRYGNTVVIDHGARRSLYAHLDSVAVRAGQRVAAGQLIGAVGRTGYATGAHLHFELREDGAPVDPADVLAGLDARATRHALAVRRAQQGY